jgi:hypothetical protein
MKPLAQALDIFQNEENMSLVVHFCVNYSWTFFVHLYFTVNWPVDGSTRCPFLRQLNSLVDPEKLNLLNGGPDHRWGLVQPCVLLILDKCVRHLHFRMVINLCCNNVLKLSF